MHRLRLLSAAGAAALGLALLTPPALASATSPSPTPNQKGHPAPHAAPDHALTAPATTSYRQPARTHAVAAPHVRAQDLTGLTPGSRALLADRDAGKISADAFIRAALGRLGQPFPVTGRYQGASASATELQVLALAVNQQTNLLSATDRTRLRADANRNRAAAHAPAATTAAIAAPTTAAAAAATVGSVSCGDLTHYPYTCSIAGAHTVVRWSPSGFRSLSSTQLADTDNDGRPDFPAQTSTTLEQAYDTYAALGLSTPPSRVEVTLNSPAAGSGVSLPGTLISAPTILLPGSFDTSYLPAHELFHQFQWPYIVRGSILGGLGGVALGVSNINWWMEATAEWGAMGYLDQVGAPEGVRTLPARLVPTFLRTTSNALSYSDGLGGSRQYGTMAAVTWFTQRLGTDFVRHSWENVAGDTYIDGTSDIADTITGYGADQGTELGILWDAMNQLCDPYPAGSWDSLRMQHPDVPAWCSNYLQVASNGLMSSGIARPPFNTADPATAASQSKNVGPGGAAYTDMTLSPTELGRSLTFTATSSSPAGSSSARLLARTWGDYNPGDGVPASPAQYCDAQAVPFSGDSATLTVELNPSCPHLTLTQVNTDLTGGTQTLTVSWTSRLTGAAISNGVIRLGVADSGNLIIDDGTRSTSGSYGLGLRYLPTGHDALAPGCWCEGWGLSAPNTDGSVAAHGFADADYGGLRGGTVVSFTATDTEAWSTVQVGDYQVLHHYHPSADPRMYQVDVFLTRNIGAGLSPNATYRRVMDFDAEPTAFNEYMTVHVDPADTAITDDTNDGFTYPDPTQALDDLGSRGSFTDVGPDDQGAAFDFSAPVDSLRVLPSLTLFYGAGSSAADAKAGLDAVGATSYALAKPSSSPVDQGTPNTFAFGYKAG